MTDAGEVVLSGVLHNAPSGRVAMSLESIADRLLAEAAARRAAKGLAERPAKPPKYAGNPAYRCWTSMIQRCTNPNVKSYPRYGGRGIKVCDRWRYSFEAFLEDMGERPSKGHSIDRYPDKNGNYEPGNARWATILEQNNNMRRRSGVMTITHDGRTLTIKEWAAELGLHKANIARRLQEGWSVHDALTTPPLTPKDSRNKRRVKRGLAGLHRVIDPERTKPE